ncbi:hypothetical protein LTR17_004585 [Elasticomyces elasticus]|nr:hypothetical protein LTR17_004585 [Elasticomyces elasticus]
MGTPRPRPCRLGDEPSVAQENDLNLSVISYEQHNADPVLNEKRLQGRMIFAQQKAASNSPVISDFVEGDGITEWDNLDVASCRLKFNENPQKGFEILQSLISSANRYQVLSHACGEGEEFYREHLTATRRTVHNGRKITSSLQRRLFEERTVAAVKAKGRTPLVRKNEASAVAMNVLPAKQDSAWSTGPDSQLQDSMDGPRSRGRDLPTDRPILQATRDYIRKIRSIPQGEIKAEEI